MHEHRHRRGFRPHWWPEDEPFPRAGGRPWHGTRKRLLRRVLLVVGLFFGLTVAPTVLAGRVAPRVFELPTHNRLAPFAALVRVRRLVGGDATRRAARRMARPVAGL